MPSSLKPGTVLREQPNQSGTVHEICTLLKQIVKLYQIPNFDEINAVLLAEWIMDNYRNEQIETIIKCLSRPRMITNQRNWRLTPDTVQEWMVIEIEREAVEREKQIHNAKHEGIHMEWSGERLKEWEELINKSEGLKPPAPLTQKEILEEGQARKKPNYVPPSAEYVIDHQLKVAWGRECHDLLTGKPNDKWMSFDEWIKMQ